MHHFTPALILPLLMSLLLLIPEVGRAYQAPEADTTYVLTIYEQAKPSTSPFQTAHKQIGYLSAGDQVNLTLANGNTLRGVQITQVGKTELVIGGKLVAISSISQIEKVGPKSKSLRNNRVFYFNRPGFFLATKSWKSLNSSIQKKPVKIAFIPSPQPRESNTTYVLAMRKLGAPSNTSYCAAGAIVHTLRLKDGRFFGYTTINKVGKSKVTIGEEEIPIADIAEMKVKDIKRRRFARNILFRFILLLTMLAAISIATVFISFGGSAAFLLLLLVPALVLLFGLRFIKKVNRFEFSQSTATLDTAPLDSVPPRVREKLAKKFFVN